MSARTTLSRVAVPRGNVSNLFDPDSSIERRLKGLLTKVLEGGTDILTIIGGYGLGKTHSLKYLSYMASTSSIKAVYVSSPGRTFLDFYAAVVENLLDEVLKSSANVDNPVLKRALDLLREGNPDTLVYVKGWLLGYSIPSNVRYRLGLIGSVREDNAVSLLSEVLSHAVSSLRGVLMLLDEMEILLNLPKNLRFSYMEALRELIDAMPSSTALAVSMTPACWDEVMNLNPALYRRLSGNVLYLKPLRREHVGDFVKHHLGDLHSLLRAEVYDYIYELTNGVHGEVLKYALILLEEGLQRASRTPLDAEAAKHILSEYT